MRTLKNEFFSFYLGEKFEVHIKSGRNITRCWAVTIVKALKNTFWDFQKEEY